MTTTRLHWNYPIIAQTILDLPPDRVKLVVQAAVRLALQNAELNNDVTDSILAAVDGHATVGEPVRGRLEQMQEEYDNHYLDMQDQDMRDARQPIPEEGLRSFYRARALASLLRALDGPDDPATAADVVYEAIASSPDESINVAALSRLII